MYFIGWNEISHHIIVAWNLFQGVIFQEVKVMTQILLVEDDGALAMGIEFTLKEEGYKREKNCINNSPLTLLC